MLATALTTETPKVKTSGTDLVTSCYIHVSFDLLKNAIPAEFLPEDDKRTYSILFMMDMNSTEGAIQIDSNRPLAATWDIIISGQRKLASEIDIFGNFI